MANNLVNVDNITYCGKEGQEIFSKSLYSLDLASSGITMMDNVKGKQKIYNGDISSVFQEYSCAFTPEGEVILNEDFIEPAKIKVNMEECYDAWENTWLVEQTKVALDGGIPQDFANWFFDKLVEKMKREYQEIFWQGDTAHSGSTKKYLKVIDGIEKQLKADGAKTITGSKITAANVIAQVEGVIDAGLDIADAGEVDTADYAIMMNYADVRTLVTALGKLCCGNSTTDVFSNYAKSGDSVFINGFKVIPTMQSRHTIIFGNPKNLVLGYDTADSQIEYRLIDMRETTGDNMFRVIALTNIAAGKVNADLFTISSL